MSQNHLFFSHFLQFHDRRADGLQSQNSDNWTAFLFSLYYHSQYFKLQFHPATTTTTVHQTDIKRTNCPLLPHRDNSEVTQVCVEPRTSALDMTLPATAVRARAADICR